MKKLTIIFLLSSLIGTVAVTAKPSGGDAAMTSFWDQFKAAVTKGDKQAVFAMTQLPVGMSYGESRIRTRAQFMKQYTHIFAGEVNATKCFETAKPQVDNAKPKEFVVTCPFTKNSGGDEPFVYTFKLTRSGWRFVSFENINE
jgi:hypothetical protein